jgi:hypothetical protein
MPIQLSEPSVVESGEVKSDYFGDLRHLRNDIAHSRAWRRTASDASVQF